MCIPSQRSVNGGEERLRGLTGKFLLSLNDTPEIRKIFSRFQIKGLEMTYSSQRKPGKIYRELLISNYRIPAETAAE
jgi:DNA adenine methylase